MYATSEAPHNIESFKLQNYFIVIIILQLLSIESDCGGARVNIIHAVCYCKVPERQPSQQTPDAGPMLD